MKGWTLRQAVVFKRWSQSEATPLPPLAWTIDVRQDWSIPSCCFWSYLNVAEEIKAHQAWQCFSIVQHWWDHANCSSSFLFCADMSGTWYCLLLLWPIRLKVQWVASSEMFVCVPWSYNFLLDLLLPFYYLKQVCPSSSDLWYQHDIFPTDLQLNRCFLFSDFLCKPWRWLSRKIPVVHQFLRCSD